MFHNFFGVTSTVRKRTERTGTERDILHAEGIVEDRIAPRGEGRIKLYGVYWLARTDEPQSIAVGASVVVVGRAGLTLLVRPVINS